MNKIKILVPMLNPDEKFLKTITELSQNTLCDIIIVNDGSLESYKEFFEKAVSIERCTVINHIVNLGKGRALKTGFNYVLNNFSDLIGVVTVDGDGQHLTDDVIACINRLEQNPHSLILGCRDFLIKNVPSRSSIGNRLTSKVMNLLCGVNVPDTQTGLRGIPKEFMIKLMNISGERFDFETNMLIGTKTYKIPIEIVEIKTIYIENNRTSHFNPLTDSFKVYSTFLKFASTSLISAGIDIAVFAVLIWILNAFNVLYFIFIATLIARIISSFANYKINKNAVFKGVNRSKSQMLKYLFLCLIQLVLSAYIVNFSVQFWKTSVILSKVIVDIILFSISFIIQREWVFIKNKKI